MKTLFIHSTALCLALAQTTVQAQTLTLPYESVFKSYQMHQDVPLQDWKTSNEAVRTAGGWRAYQREAQAPDLPASVPKAGTMPAPNPEAIPPQAAPHGGKQ